MRLIAATHRNLAEEVSAGRFRQDLYYRLNVADHRDTVAAPATEDIPQLAQHFLKRYTERNRKTVKGVHATGDGPADPLPWPGNIRELEKRGGAGGGATDPETISLSENCRWRSPVRRCHQAGAEERGIQPLVEVEKEVILAALGKTGGNKTEAARRSCGITRKTLLAKLSRLPFTSDGAPADIATAKATVPANVGQQLIGALLRLRHGVTQRGDAQHAPAVGDHARWSSDSLVPAWKTLPSATSCCGRP